MLKKIERVSILNTGAIVLSGNLKVTVQKEDVGLGQNLVSIFSFIILAMTQCGMILLYRGGLVEASYLEGGEQQLANRYPSVNKQPNFSLSFKDDL